MELKKPIAQLGNSKQSLISRMNQTEDRISSLKGKAENLNQIRKENEKLKTKETNKNIGNEHTENVKQA